MAGFIGRVGEFVGEKETFRSYVERMDMFFMANGVVEVGDGDHDAADAVVVDRKRAIFLTEIGPEAYSTLSNLLTPAKPKDTTLADIIIALEGYYNPAPLEISESFHFNMRNQKQGESVGEYIVALRKLSIHCNYGEFLNRALRDRFVCGLNNVRIQNKLLNTADLTFELACRTATSMEMADKNSREFRPSSSNSDMVNKLSANYSRSSSKSPAHSDSRQKPSGQRCTRCTGDHASDACRHKNSKCYKCLKFGHIAPACKPRGDSGFKPKQGKVHEVSTDCDFDDGDDTDELGIYSLYATSTGAKTGYNVPIVVNGQTIEMQIDTAADYSIMSKDVYEKLFKDTKLVDTTVRLKTYSGETLKLCGEMRCDIEYKGQKVALPIVIAECMGKPTLLGRNWLEKLRLEWGEIFSTSARQSDTPKLLSSLLDKHKVLFDDGYEGIKGFEAHIRVREDARPAFVKARPVPYALKERVETELTKLENHGVIVKTTQTDWASPIVVVPKADKSVRICGDYKVTLNQSVDDEQYPLPTTQDLYAALAGSKVFTKLDLSHAYAQMNVDKESQKYLTINTHKGLYSYTKLPYGVKSSPKIFQAVMDKILHGVPKCLCNQDDILIGGSKVDEHIEILSEVLDRLQKHNVHLNREKCVFMKSEAVYLGLRVDADGLHPVEEKIAAIKDAPVPKNVSQLRSFLGMVQYYARFLPGLSTTLVPLHELLKKDVKWKWTNDAQIAYETCKQSLSSDDLVVHYDTKRELRLACDASSYGLGAVISHVMEDGQERPIAFASRTLNTSEKNYAQIEKEALSIVFGVKKFHQYLYGRKFTLVTDHKPLLAILGPKAAIPTLAAARMQRWALILSAHDYDIEYRRSEDHANADALSRLPYQDSSVGSEGAVYTLGAVSDDFPVKAADIAQATRRDPVLSKVYQHCMAGWAEKCTDEDIKPYHVRRHELSCEQGCVMWGIRVVIPLSLRDKMLRELHQEHPGVCSMKAIGRSCMWWPKMDAQVEQLVKGCTVCQNVRSAPPCAPLHPWTWPIRPFQRVHIDFCEKDKNNFLVLVDSHSKWIDVKHMSSTTAERTIDELRLIFANHGLPEEIVSDNGPQFTSGEFSDFMSKNGIKHTLVPPYHAASNGAAERSVRIVKEALAKQVLDGKKGMSMKHRLANFLIKYRTTPQSVTGRTPAELMVKRQLRTRLSLIKPNLAQVVAKQAIEAKTVS
jgi:hypothetical protein